MRKLLILTLLVFAGRLVVPAQEPALIPGNKEIKPISIGIVVDNSGSFRQALDYVVDTTKLIANDVGIADEGFLVRFVGKDKIETMQELTNNKTSLSFAAEDMFCEGGLTAIPEALLYSTKYLSEKGKNERKILVLITDGESKSDKQIYGETISFLKEKKIPVYIIGITMLLEKNIGESKKFLEKLAAETGGTVVFVNRKTSAAEAANAIVKAFRAQ